MKSRFTVLFGLSLLLTALPTVASTAVAVPMCRGLEATIVGTVNDDVLVGTHGRDVIVGLAGADSINGRGGNDVICGNNGNDRLEGRGGRDILDGGNGKDRLLGGSGQDRLYGGDNVDTLLGGGGRDLMNGHRGRDTLLGGGGDDRMFGGSGNDLLRGQAGFDRLDGGPERDRCFGELELNCEVAARTGGMLTLRQWQAPTVLNPYLRGGTKDLLAASLVLEPLAEVTPGGDLVPVLATRVPTVANGGVAADFRSITWRLIDTVWSDGSPLTAADVVFTYQYCSNPNTGCSSSAYTGITSVQAVNARTVKVTFDAPTPYPYTAFVGYQAPIIQKAQFGGCVGAAAQGCTAANLGPIGTGPYKVTEFRPDDAALYAFNPRYRDSADGKPFFGEVLIRGGGSAFASARSVLELGTADFAWNLQVDPVVLENMETAGIGTVYTGFSSNVEHINLNQTNPDGSPPSDYDGGANPNPFFFENQVLHDAMSMAIDRDEIVAAAYGFAAEPTCNIWNVGAQTSANNDSCLTQDVAGANALLDANGYLDTNADGVREMPGGGAPLEFEFVTSTNAVRQATQALIESYWSQIGVAVNMTNVDASLFFADPNFSDASIWKFFTDIQMYTNGPGSPDAAGYLGSWTTAEIPESTNNWTGDNLVRLANPAFDNLHAQLLAAPVGDPARDGLVIQLNDIIVDYSTIPLVHRGSVSAFANSIEGQGDLNGWDSEYWNVEDWRRSR